ncbi:MAG: 4Fe-4S binding protein [Planctomycetes bacterium]|nr:4Fe-4S binding protein [Planctomycetota bacterium]
MKRRWPIWTILRRTTALGFLAAIVWAARGEVEVFRGSTTATRLFGVLRLADPLAALELQIASRGVDLALVGAAAVLLVVAALLGPVFCGWVCPFGLLADLNGGLRLRLSKWLMRRRRLRLWDWRLPRATRWVALAFVLGMALTARLPVYQAVSPINQVPMALAFMQHEAWFVIAALLVVEWFVPRVWCRALCPTGALYALVGRWAPLRIRIDRQLAGRSPCRQCSIHCPMGIRVMEDHTLRGKSSIDDLQCSRCGNCLEVCMQGVLGWTKKEAGAAPEETAPAD